MKQNFFIKDHRYIDSGQYKSNPNDEFGISFLSGSKTITNQGGIRRRYFETDITKKLNINYKIPAVMVLVSTCDNVALDVEKPWIDSFVNSKLIYHGDNKPRANGKHSSPEDREGCRNLIAVNELIESSKGNSRFIPPILFFEKKEQGYMNFVGLFKLDSIERYNFKGNCENISAKLSYLSGKVNMVKIRERPLLDNEKYLLNFEDFST